MNKNYLFALLATLLLAGCAKQEKRFYQHEGYVFGTIYNIRYEAEQDLMPAIEEALKDFDASLSMFNRESTISRINRGETQQTDSLFRVLYQTAHEVSQISDGAFDITVRPLVNLWGFGNSKAEGKAPQRVDEKTLDSIRSFVGYQMVDLRDDQLIKLDPRTTLDASAIAKGFGVDVVANLIHSHGSENYLVDIGGEVVALGHNQYGNPWRIGIGKPIDDPDGTKRPIQQIIETDHLAMATSGNYRQFYQDGDVRRSHTIDPRTGYPVQHTLLSATVVANTCMQADALATACMVLGADDALRMIDGLEKTECYLIVADGDSTKIITSAHWTGSF